MKIGDKLRGVITGIKPYGAFVSLENGTTGLIHISEIKTGYIDNIYNTLKVDQEVLVQVASAITPPTIMVIRQYSVHVNS